MINKKVKADHGSTNSHRHYSIPTKEHDEQQQCIYNVSSRH